MDFSNPIPARTPTGGKRKREPAAEDAEASPSENKRSRGGGAWDYLDLILSLQNKDIPLQRKVELAFDFVNSDASCCDRGPLEAVSTSRLASFLSNWIQPILISSENGRKYSELSDPCLDYRCWVILKFCLAMKPSIAVSPNLLRAITRVAGHGLMGVDWGSSSSVEESTRLFQQVLECLSLLISSNARVFCNAGVDLWISCSVETVKLLRKVSASEKPGSPDGEVLPGLCLCFLRHFSSFLSSHPNPKNIFRAFVDRILDPLLELLVLLHSQVKGEKFGEARIFLKVVEEILSNGLFHPSHIGGFLSLKSLNERVASREEHTKIKGSYHAQFFLRFKGITGENKPVLLAGFGHLFRLFVSRFRNQRGASVASKDKAILDLRKSAEAPEEAQEVNKPLLEIFVQFMEPLLLECKEYKKTEFLKLGVVRLVESHCMLKSVNETLTSFIQEKIYARTDDTSEGTHFTFLQKIYDTIISLASELYQFWSATPSVEDASIKKMLQLIAREIFVAVGYFLEIEYKVMGDDLVKLWLMMFAFMAVDVTTQGTGPSSLLVLEIIKLGCLVINIFSELRQVSHSIFCFCKAVRLFGVAGDASRMEHPFSNLYLPLSSRKFLEPFVTFVCSQEFRLAIINSVKLMPERQASGYVEELKLDLTETLKWMRNRSSVEDILDPKGKMDFELQAELLGRVFAELYTAVMDSLMITTSNCVLVGSSVEDLMKTVRPSFSSLVRNQPDNTNEFIFSIIGTSMPDIETPECESFSWIFVFFFRLFTSCRSLYCQSISLMPPNSARKASELMGSIFATCSGMEWTNGPALVDGGYFSWIIKPSSPLLDVIQDVSKAVLKESYATNAQFLYVLHIMALQRLNDLDRQIKAYKFLKEGEARQFLITQHGSTNKHKAIKRWKMHLNASKFEAAELTNFMMRHAWSLLLGSKFSRIPFFSNECTWDLNVCSINEFSFPIGIWWLLCRNIDTWSAYASKKDLKGFFSVLVDHSMSYESTCINVKENKNGDPLQKEVTLHNISLALLGDTVIYDETVLSKNFMSAFCHALKKSLSFMVNHTCATDENLDLLPDFSEILTTLDEGVVYMDDLALHVHSSRETSDSVHVLNDTKPNDKATSMSFVSELTTSERLLNRLCKMPRIQLNAKLYSRCATYILHLERLAISNLLCSRAEPISCNPFELLRLFLSCRRALRYLMESEEEAVVSCVVSVFSSSLGSSSSMVWLLKSVSALVGLPHALYGENSDKLRNMTFSVVDHTSKMLFALSSQLLTFASSLVTNDKFVNSPVNDDTDISEKWSDSSECNAAWKKVEFMAQLLVTQARNLPVNPEVSRHSIKLANCYDVLYWNKVFCTVSCLQGFLSGFVSSQDRTSKLFLWRASKLSPYIAVFENFLDICLYILLVDNNRRSAGENFACNLPRLVCDNGLLNLDALLDRSTERRDFEAARSADNHNEKTRKPEALSENCIPSCCSKSIANILDAISLGDLSDPQHLKGSLIDGLLKGENPHIAFALRDLFIASAAILNFKSMQKHSHEGLSNMDMSLGNLSLQKCGGAELSSFSILVEASHIILRDMDAMCRPDTFSFFWIDGILRYLEVVGSYLAFDPKSSKVIYSELINSYLRAIGKCISLQGKSATLSTHETGSNTKSLHLQKESGSAICLNSFKSRVRLSLKKLMGGPLKVHKRTAMQVIERAVVGVHPSCHVIYNIRTGNSREVSSVAAAGIDCLYLVLESLPGSDRVLKKSIPNLVGSLFNIVLHLQNETIFYVEKPPRDKVEFHPDPGAVVLMCVEVLTTVVGKHSLQMDVCYVSQCLHIPVTLFKNFHLLKASRIDQHLSIPCCSHEVGTCSDERQFIIDCQFSIDLYAACCKLLRATLKHQTCEVGQCVAVLQDSVTTLLKCLECVDASLVSMKDYFAWNVQEATASAAFFRRIYEEIRQQKDVLGTYSHYFLSSYISICSGYGPFKAGIKREVDEALRPGVYSLIDSCSPADLQQLHTVLGEGPCRSTLATLVHDYRLHFQYEGKI